MTESKTVEFKELPFGHYWEDGAVPCRLVHNESGERKIVTKTAIKDGTLLMASEFIAYAVHETLREKVCHFCFRRKAQVVSAELPSVRYCSTQCAVKHGPQHLLEYPGQKHLDGGFPPVAPAQTCATSSLGLLTDIATTSDAGASALGQTDFSESSSSDASEAADKTTMRVAVSLLCR